MQLAHSHTASDKVGVCTQIVSTSLLYYIRLCSEGYAQGTQQRNQYWVFVYFYLNLHDLLFLIQSLNRGSGKPRSKLNSNIYIFFFFFKRNYLPEKKSCQSTTW